MTTSPTLFLSDGSTDRGLALKFFGGSVLVAYRKSSILYDMMGMFVWRKQATGLGKTAAFPILSDNPAPEYHTPGTTGQGQQQPFRELTITADDILKSDRAIPLDQKLMSHFDASAPYAEAIGQSLGEDLDSRLFRMAVKAARTAALSGYHAGGNRVTRVVSGTEGNGLTTPYPASGTGADNFIDDLGLLGQRMDEDNVPKENRYAFIPPYIRRVLGYKTNIFSKDYINGENNLLNRVIGKLEGFNMIESNNLPSGAFNRANPPSNPTKYNVDCSYVNAVAGVAGRPACVVLCGGNTSNAAIGMVDYMGLETHMEDIKRDNVTYMRGQHLCGFDVLCPWSAGVIDAMNS